MLEKLKKMKLTDYLHLLILLLCYLPSKLVKWWKQDIWIISENGDDSKDNGIAFFRYLERQGKEKNIYYVISKNMVEQCKVDMNPKHVLVQNSLKHIIYTMACKNYISSQLASSFPYSNIFFNLYHMNIFQFNYVFLQHGITQNFVECFTKENSKIRLFCCAANPEYQFVKEKFGYKDEEIEKTGFCRYDNLLNEKVENKDILMMFTWRKDYEILDESKIELKKQEFKESEYYKNIQGLIQDRRIIEMLKKNNSTLYLCIHDNMKHYKDCFEVKDEHIKIVDKNSEKTVDELIRECRYLVTDFSSVAFDFAYTNKPVQYFQFDYEEFRRKHLKEGYFDYSEDGFGKVSYNLENCINNILEMDNSQFEVAEIYKARTQDFFCYQDMKNCERTYQAIKNIKVQNDTEVYNTKSKIAIIGVLLSAIIGILGLATSNFNALLISNLIIVVLNIICPTVKGKRKAYFSIFQIMIFTFLLSRPTIKMFRGEAWWENYQIYSQLFAQMAIWVTSFCMLVGSYITKWIKIGSEKMDNNRNKRIQIISKILFYFTSIFSLIVEFDKLFFMKGKEYVEYYLTYSSDFPSWMTLIAGMNVIFLVIYLVTQPEKKKTVIPLVIYIISNLPTFLIGQRNPLILAVLFSFMYFIFRDIVYNKQVWIGKLEKAAIVITIPIVIIGLAIFNYTRVNEKIENNNPLNLFVDFFYTQGVSYDVLNIAYLNIPQIKILGKNYTFGPAIDYLKYNTISRALFHTKDLGTGNNEKKALEGNSFSHINSYLSRDDYLEGHGYGSSYLLELYHDYGFWGIIIFSILLGAFLIKIPELVNKKNILSIITLMATTQIFLLPRAETIQFVLFIITPHFWIATIGVWLIEKIWWRIERGKRKNES